MFQHTIKSVLLKLNYSCMQKQTVKTVYYISVTYFFVCIEWPYFLYLPGLTEYLAVLFQFKDVDYSSFFFPNLLGVNNVIQIIYKFCVLEKLDYLTDL
jgi:hypothetical protein